jgi:hypothetical protein
MSIWLLLIVMSLAVYRLTKLVVEDTFPPVLWLRDRLAGGWRPLSLKESERYAIDVASVTEGPVAAPHPELGALMRTDGEVSRFVRRSRFSPYWLAELISCPWCASGWVALAVTAGTWATVGLPVPLLVWPAVWAAGALLAAQEWA